MKVQLLLCVVSALNPWLCFAATKIQTTLGEVMIDANRLKVSSTSSSTSIQSLTGDQLVGALYGASYDGRYVLYAGARSVRGEVFPDPSLYVLDLSDLKIVSLQKDFSIHGLGGAFSPVAAKLAVVDPLSRKLAVFDFPSGQKVCEAILSSSDDLDFAPRWSPDGQSITVDARQICSGCGMSGTLGLKQSLPHSTVKQYVIDAQTGTLTPNDSEPVDTVEQSSALTNAMSTIADGSNEVGGQVPLRLPYPAGASYVCTQGPSGTVSHRGFEVDFGMPDGSVVVAAASGIVYDGGDWPSQTTTASGSAANGTHVILLHQGTDKQYLSYYLHLRHPRQSNVATKNTEVNAGDPIGMSSNTGFTLPAGSGYHLHFQMRETSPAQPIGFGVRPTPMKGTTSGTSEDLISEFIEGQTYLAADLPPPGEVLVKAIANDTGLRVAGTKTHSEESQFRTRTRMAFSAFARGFVGLDCSGRQRVISSSKVSFLSFAQILPTILRRIVASALVPPTQRLPFP